MLPPRRCVINHPKPDTIPESLHVCWARTLVVWFQQLACATGTLAKAAAKRLRWTLWHTPGRLTRSGRRTTIRLPTNHPGAAHLARIYNHIAALS